MKSGRVFTRPEHFRKDPEKNMNQLRIDRNTLHRNLRVGICLTVGFALLAPVLAGCGEKDTPIPTQSEVKAADVNRQAYIDKLNIPEDQKAIMKSHMGGPPVSTAMDAAKSGAAAPKGARPQ